MTRFKIVTAGAATLVLVGAASMALAAPSAGTVAGQPDQTGTGGMMDGSSGPGSMLAGDGASTMQADPEQMLRWHEEMHARYPEMERHMDEFGMGATDAGAPGSHCPGGESPEARASRPT